ncbi:hypothetical protein [Nonomuraea dietziae]|uniref:hypothetical protein n=1 Tax=Nonomuraea dietziae TaxID=65515 RepID=UPI0031D9213D
MHTDVPGAVVGLVDALNAARRGATLASRRRTTGGRSCRTLHGGAKLTRALQVARPQRNELLVWFTDTPHGHGLHGGQHGRLA